MPSERPFDNTLSILPVRVFKKIDLEVRGPEYENFIVLYWSNVPCK